MTAIAPATTGIQKPSFLVDCDIRLTSSRACDCCSFVPSTASELFAPKHETWITRKLQSQSRP
ncbi:hypothetical protein ARTHRO9AX_220234 [Arthrobacter sp. 9AX]|nr:hypothetical protein ARTHRO9AX_220234 [Arthrobacter sp. 9AX]